MALDDTIPTRRRTRGQPDERDKTSSKLDDVEMTSVDDDIQEDDEAVRCICGFDDYPGPPPRDDDARLNSKETIDLESIYLAEGADDLAGFFVQCDICKVWQHGACVGITNEESSPEEYFCEECRKEFHKIYTAKNGYISPLSLVFIWHSFGVVRRCASTCTELQLRQLGADQVKSTSREAPG